MRFSVVEIIGIGMLFYGYFSSGGDVEFRKRWWKRGGIVILVGVLLDAGFAFYLYNLIYN